MRTVLAAIAVTLFGGMTLWSGTDGLRAFTTEQARRLAVMESPRSLPDALLQDQDGRPLRLSDYRGRPLLVDFVYTQCRSICGALSASFKRLAEPAEREPSAQYLLLSISFDPDRDTPSALSTYARRYGADAGVWRFARVRDARQLGGLLNAFGFVVIPDGSGEFQHNGAIHLVDRSGRLAGIFDYDAIPRVRAVLREHR